MKTHKTVSFSLAIFVLLRGLAWKHPAIRFRSNKYVFREVGLSFKERSFPIKLQLEGSGRIRQDIDDMTIKDESLCVCLLVREC